MRATLALLAVLAAGGCGDSEDPDRNRVVLRVEGPGVVHVQPDEFDCDGECIFHRPDGARLFLTAVPERGATLTSWSAPCAATDSRCTVEGPAQTITAIFAATCPEPWALEANDVVDMDVHPSGWLVTTGARTQAWDTVGCTQLWSSDRGGSAVAFDRQGNVFLAKDREIALLAGPNGFPLWQRTIDPTVLDVGVDQNNRFAAVGTRAGMGWMGSYNSLDGTTAWEREPGPGEITALAMDGDSFWVAGSWDGRALVAGYRTETRVDRFQLTLEDASSATSVSVLPDGTVAALVDADALELRRYEAADGSEIGADAVTSDMLAGPFAVGSTVTHVPTGVEVASFDAAPTAAVAGGDYLYVATGDRVERIEIPR